MDIPSSKKSRSQVKTFFVKNAIPTEGNFADLIEAGVNQRDDGLVKTKGNPLSIEAGGDDGSQRRALSLYRSFEDPQPACVLSLNPFADPENPETAAPGLGIGDAAGNARLFLDPATGRLGLGTVTPAAGLDIRSSARGTWLAAGPGGDSGRITLRYGGVGEPDAPVIALSDLDDPPRIRFDNIGGGTDEDPEFSCWIGMAKGRTRELALMAERVGIDTVTPQARLQVHGGAIMPHPGNGRDAGIRFPDDPWRGGGDSAWIRYYARSGENTTFEIGTSNDRDDNIALMASGRVGIGTREPTHDFHVKSGNAVGLFESTGTHAYLRLHAREGMDHRVELACRPGGRLALWVHKGHDALNITREGHVGIGTQQPEAQLDVNGPIYCSNSDIYFTNTSHRHTATGNREGWAAIENDSHDYKALMILGRTRTLGGGLAPRWSQRVVKLWDYLDVNGTLQVNGNTVNASDMRDKTDIELLQSGLATVNRLRPVSFNWRERANPNRSLGLIAQEVREVMPDLVYDEEGGLCISYLGIIPILINAIQELERKLAGATAR